MRRPPKRLREVKMLRRLIDDGGQRSDSAHGKGLLFVRELFGDPGSSVDETIDGAM